MDKICYACSLEQYYTLPITETNDPFDPFITEEEATERIMLERNKTSRRILLVIAAFFSAIFFAFCSGFL